MPPHIILLAGNPQYPQQRAAIAAITPGHLIEMNGTGLRKHATSAGPAAPWFADVNQTPDSTAATEAIDTPYAVGETVKWMACRPGDQVYAWVPAAAVAIVAGDFLMSNGDGCLRKITGVLVDGATVAQALEAVDNSAGGSPARIKVYAL